MTVPELSIVMPCLNEERTLPNCLKKAFAYLEEHGVEGEVIVADNGSTDRSREIAAEYGARVVPVERRGYGAALAGGIDAARGQYVIMGDCDESYDFSALAPFVEKLREGYDLVMGNRFAGGIAERAMPPLHRYFGNPLLTFLGRLFFKSPCGDFYCGLRGFRKDAYERLQLRTPGMEFALEMLVKATVFKLKVTEVPTTLSPDGRDRPPHLRSWRDGWRSLRFYLLFAPKWLFWYPGLLLMALGLVLGGLLAAGPVELDTVRFDVHSLSYCALAVIVGFQAASFAIFVKIIAVRTGLHPPNPRVDRIVRGLRLELGVITGLVLIAVGLGISIYAVFVWSAEDFGNLDPFSMMRVIIPAVTFVALGFQLALTSFCLGFLQFIHRQQNVPAQ